MAPRIIVRHEDFDAGAEIARLHAQGAGAIGNFVGIVRSSAVRPIVAMTLEHYPGMTEASIAGIAAEAERRFDTLGCTIIHRHGRLLAGEQIVFVGVAASHRGAALACVGFLMDWLKTRAPFWKQEEMKDGTTNWVESRWEDEHAAGLWDSGLP